MGALNERAAANAATNLEEIFRAPKTPLPRNQVEALDMIAMRLACIVCGYNDGRHWRDISNYAGKIADDLQRQSVAEMSSNDEWGLK